MKIKDVRLGRLVWVWSGSKWEKGACLRTFKFHDEERIWIALSDRPGHVHAAPDAVVSRHPANEGHDKPAGTLAQHSTIIFMDDLFLVGAA